MGDAAGGGLLYLGGGQGSIKHPDRKVPQSGIATDSRRVSEPQEQKAESGSVRED
jgi:hypothetical protein